MLSPGVGMQRTVCWVMAEVSCKLWMGMQTVFGMHKKLPANTMCGLC